MKRDRKTPAALTTASQVLDALGTLDAATPAMPTSEIAWQNIPHAFSLIYQGASDVMFLMSVEPDGQFICRSVNRAYLTSTGLPEADVLGKTPQDILPADAARVALTYYAEAIRTRQPQYYEERVDTPDWHAVVETTLTPICDAQRQCTHLLGISRDITASKQTADELLQEQNLLRTLIDHLPDCIYIKDVEARYIINNATHLCALGVTDPAALVGKTVFDLHPTELARQYYADEMRVIQTGEPLLHREERVRYANGTEAWHLTSKLPLRDRQGNLIGLVGISRNITERKRATAELTLQKTRLEQLFENSPLAIAMVDAQDHFIKVNRAFEQLFQYTTAEVKDLPINSLLGTAQLDAELSALSAQVLRGASVAKETWRRRKDGRLVPVYALGVPIKIDGVITGLYALYQDIAERQQNEATLTRYAEGMQSLYHTALEINSQTDLRTLLHAIIERACRLVNVPMGGVYLLQPDQRTLELVVHIPSTLVGTRVQIGEDVGGHITQHGAPLMIENYATWADRASALTMQDGVTVGRVLGVPLKLGVKVIGALMVEDNAPGVFSEDDALWVSLFADQAAIAIENARLIAEANRRADQLDHLSQIGIALTTGLQVEQILRAVDEQCRQVAPIDSFYVAVYDPAVEEIRFPLFRDREVYRQLPPYSIRNRTPLTAQIIRTKRTLVIADLLNPTLIPAGVEPVRTNGPAARMYVGVPMISRDKVIGVLSLQNYQAAVYSPDQVHFFETIATQAAVALDNARLFEETNRRADRMAALNEIGRALTATLERDQFYRLLYEQVSNILPTDAFYVALYDETREVIHFPFNVDRGRVFNPDTFPLGQGPTSQVIRTRTALAFGNANEAPQTRGVAFGNEDERCASALHVPMIVGKHVVGVISAQSYRTNAYTAEDLQVLQTIASQSAVAVENVRLYEQVQQLAITDELTGLYNRRGLFQLGEREIERAFRFHRPLAAILFDIDHFKQVNDTHTHAVGDLVLRGLANCCRHYARTIDLAGRYGGEEFLVLLPETPLAAATQAAERLRAAIAQTCMTREPVEIYVTVSMGVAALDTSLPDLDALIQRADQALYLAKSSGRNCIQVA